MRFPKQLWQSARALAQRRLRKRKELDKAFILRLPNEILIIIMDNLERHDKYFLAQSCKTMRILASYCWEGETAPLESRDIHRFWYRLSYVLPDVYMCGRCRRLHKIDSADTPQTAKPLGCSPLLSRTHCGYVLRHRHVMLALKYSRLGNVHEEYLRKLMARHQLTTLYGNPHYAARPMIVQGRFILFERWFWRHIGALEDMSRGGLMLCPHTCVGIPAMGIRSSPWLWELNGPVAVFQRLIRRAFNNPGREIHDHCRDCHTDFLIVVCKKGTVLIRVWQDFGGFSHLRDEVWEKHNWNERRGLGRHMIRRAYVPHVPGSVRDRYLSVYTPEDGE